MRCGTVRVPRDYAHPDGPSFALSVVVIDSEQKPALPDPVVYINGGPGEPITVYAGAQAKTPYASGRDLVLIDQRGTGGSEPRICPAMDRKLLDVTLSLGADGGVSAADARRAAFDACRREALSRGIDLSNFGTRVTANDFESVRRALNIARWNLYGESYGTDVAMTLAALHPATVRSMILDSIYPPDAPRPLRATSVAAARKAFFALCDSDPHCFAVSGDLARAYNEAKAQLAREPLILTRPPGSKWPNDRFVLTAAAFELVVANLLYYRNAYPTVPLVIMWARNGAREPLASVTAKLYEAALTRQVATTTAVECRDRPHFRGATPAPDDIFAGLSGICDTWAPLGPPLLIPAASTVPTLILAGAIDPVAEPHESRRIAEIIGSNAQWIEFPEVGHNVRAFSPCARRIVADFIAQPQGALDDSCALHPLPLQFSKTPRQQ